MCEITYVAGEMRWQYRANFCETQNPSEQCTRKYQF